MGREYKASVNSHFTFSIEEAKGCFVVNGREVPWDVLTLGERGFHILLEGHSYRASLVHADREKKTFTFRVNGQEYTVQLRDRYDLLLEKLGMENRSAAKGGEVRAPMPGLVKQVLVEEGQQVAAGDSLLILEAMKMENILKADVPGTVNAIRVSDGQAVEKNQLLLSVS